MKKVFTEFRPPNGKIRAVFETPPIAMVEVQITAINGFWVTFKILQSDNERMYKAGQVCKKKINNFKFAKSWQ